MWFYVAILAALVSGISVILSKHTLKKVDPVILYWVLITISTPFVALFAFKNGVPNLSLYFFIGIICSDFLYTFSRILNFRIIRDVPISEVYPLVALAPIFTLVLAFLPPLSEKPSLFSLLGVLISLIGVYILNVSSANKGFFEPFKVLSKNKSALLMLLSVAVLGSVSVFDKIGINGTDPQNAIFVLLCEDIIIVFGMLPYIIFKYKKVAPQIFANKWPLFGLGVLGAMGNGLSFISIGGGNVGIVSAIFRAQIFFALLFSFIFFKDKPKLEIILGTLIMIAGLVVVKLWS
jgi:drug/metabolite transporter (DMT)-like permease